MTNKFVINDFAIDLDWCGVAGISPVSALELPVAMLAQWTIEREHTYLGIYNDVILRHKTWRLTIPETSKCI